MSIPLFILLMVTSSLVIIYYAISGFKIAITYKLKFFRWLLCVVSPIAVVGMIAAGVFSGSRDITGADMSFYTNLFRFIGLVSGFILIVSVTYLRVMAEKLNKSK